MDRSSAVMALLEAQRPLPELQGELATFPWDSEHEVGSLSSRHIESVLTRFLEGALSATDVEAWANAVEGREDVAVAPGLVQYALHELANPQLTEALSASRARHWLLQFRA